jgi:hypothetical protein
MIGTEEQIGGKSGSRRQPEGMETLSEWPGRQGRAPGIAPREILSPEERMELAIQSLADGSRSFAAGIGRRIVNNPLPVALVGVGISWLLLMGRDESPGRFGQKTEGPLLKGRRRLKGKKERLDIAAGLVLERGTEMGTRLTMLARERTFALGVFAFSAGAVLGALAIGNSEDGRLRKGRHKYPAATEETTALMAHSEIRGQAGGFGPEETEMEKEMEPAV